jgi:peptidyl-prolyl cis-trans isomerase SurA
MERNHRRSALSGPERILLLLMPIAANIMTGPFNGNRAGALGSFLRKMLLTAGILCLWTLRAAGGEVVDRIVAVINDDVLTVVELDQAVQPYRNKLGAMGYSAEKERQMLFKVREDILNQLIDEKLTDQEIRSADISVTDKEVDGAIERLKAARFLTEEDLKAALARDGMSLEDYRKRVRDQLLRTKLVNRQIKSKIVITKEDVQAYYERNRNEYGGPKKYRLGNIIMPVPPPAGEQEKQAVYRAMVAVHAKLKAGESFAALAREYSQSPMASEGGDLGVFGLSDLSPQIQAAVQNLKPGEFSQILDTEYGYQIFIVQEILEGDGKTLEALTPEIESKLFDEVVNQKFADWLQELRQRAHIKIIQ